MLLNRDPDFAFRVTNAAGAPYGYPGHLPPRCVKNVLSSGFVGL